jgi:hypothetical protein
MPNPTTVAAGQTVVWTNNDTTVHHIMLANGSMIGDLAPGQSSAPIVLPAGTMSFMCAYHPSMVGTLYDPAVAPPPDAPAPPPNEDPGPYVDPYGVR